MGTWVGYGTQTHYEAPKDPWLEIVATQWKIFDKRGCSLVNDSQVAEKKKWTVSSVTKSDLLDDDWFSHKKSAFYEI